MRKTTIGILVAATVVISGCGNGGGVSPTASRPPAPVNLTVYVNNSKVSVSPTSVGAGPVVFIVTNQANHAEALAISSADGSSTLASTAPINPQATTQVSVDFKPGNYTIATAPHGSTDASLASPTSVAAASIHIGPARPSANGSLLGP
jgi:plastocyanin